YKSNIQITMERGYDNFKGAMQEHQILILCHAIVTALGFVLTILLVVFPMTHYIKQIKARESLRVMGAYECKCLAQTYNVMLAKNEDHENRLRHQAEHDALTGLLNRGTFEQMRQKLSAEKKTVGLLIVDVDKFKQVNDGYGHEMGDKVLQRVAGLLTENFGDTGIPCRVGGDEFSVILTGVAPEKEPDVQAQVEAINELLTHPADGLPVVSLSVGGAFSRDGFTDGLYKHADVALYAVKENGRCGCRFYNEKMEAIEV
ncbi:MAG: GGDEF domain-containing protein, partial [Oscillospiraceae bacterium]|nr:GGDEF domain-containing protein [Oscillospiraceae bacterium]